MSYCNFLQIYQSLFGAVIGALLASIITLFGGRYYFRLDKERDYIVNAQNVLLTLSKQINLLENIRRHFSTFENDNLRHLSVQSLLISDTEWRLSRLDITKLNSGNSRILPLIFELIIINDNFVTLLDSIYDHHQFRNPIDTRIISTGQNEISELEQNELRRHVDTIFLRLRQIELLQITNSIHSYFQELYPREIFSRPDQRI